jgi:aldose 1-epimerase
MGIPILCPWANRLDQPNYRVGDVTVALRRDAPGVRADAHVLPIHGLLGAFSGWQMTSSRDTIDSPVWLEAVSSALGLLRL